MTRIFVYGTLKRGECRAHVLSEQRFLGETRTASHYRLYDTGDYPALVEAERGVEVAGEVWDVDDRCLAILDGIEGVPDLYERCPVALVERTYGSVETYLYRRPVEGLRDCGQSWPTLAGRRPSPAPPSPLCLGDLATIPAARAAAIHIVCVGDSLTGWNNFGPAHNWPFPTYPRHLQCLCAPRGLLVADGGIAGELSDNGPPLVARYLEQFPHAAIFVVGFGTNDLGTWPDLQATSHRIIANLDQMVRQVRTGARVPVLLNVPYVNESRFSAAVARDTHLRRDYHNARLAEYCAHMQVPLADICGQLRDEHFGDELHPNDAGARIIARVVFAVLCTSVLTRD